MRRIFFIVALAAFVGALFVTMGPAHASQHNEKACEDAGGVWTNQSGTKSCVFEEEGRNDNFTCVETTSGKGNLGNKTSGPAEEEENTGSGKCPPGQYP